MATAATSAKRGYEVVDFDQIAGVACPCGIARRGLAEARDVPFTVHRVEISADARRHYHRRQTETYYILACEPGAALELDDERLPVHPGMCVLIRPGTRHRGLGRMTILNFVWPKFDPADEWYD
jgi:mannose-6-phosphate isomerase-like protein (cupin superfamily)